MVILNGVIGFVVTLFFIAMKAPDLALTQLVVENDYDNFIYCQLFKITQRTKV